MQEFSYKGIHKISILFQQGCGAISILLFTFIAGFLIFGVITFHEKGAITNLGNDPRITVTFLAFWCLAIPCGVGFMLINLFPNITLSKDGLIISAIIFSQIFIPWSEIVDIGKGNIPFGHTLVRARRISPFHRAIGWCYSGSILPSFMIGKNIKNYSLLVEEIKRGIEKRNHSMSKVCSL